MVTYDSSVFTVSSLESAKQIILTPTDGLSTEERWERETPYLADLLGNELKISPDSTVVDYGCGIGRLSKALIERFDCHVLGVDMSKDMRVMAPEYVRSANFSAVSRRMFLRLIKSGFRANAAIAVWVLQHCPRPLEDLKMLSTSLLPMGLLGVVNMNRRSLPTDAQTWVDDGVNIRELTSSLLPEMKFGELDSESVGKKTATRAYWSVNQRS